MKVYKDSTYSYITVVEIPKNEIQQLDFGLCAQPTQTLSAYYKNCEVKPTILCNGGFFDFGGGTGATCFNYIDDGEVIAQKPYLRTGMGIVNDQLIYGSLDEYNFTDFISAYPTLIVNGQKATIVDAKEINYKARRTILAYNNNNIYIIAIESPGMNFAQMQSYLLSLGVTYAINLDGGGSTKILQDGKSITSSLYNRAVDNVVAVYLKPKIIYRVQVGCFSNKKYADAFLKEIQGLPSPTGIDYKQAYLRQINKLWKVQVGAFTVRQNAVNILNDLKLKGYDAFITTT